MIYIFVVSCLFSNCFGGCCGMKIGKLEKKEKKKKKNKRINTNFRSTGNRNQEEETLAVTSR